MSALVSVTEKEFHILASDAMDAWMSGRYEHAIVLDELARKFNRALATATRFRNGYSFSRFLDVPIESPLEAAGMRTKQVKTT